MAIAVQVAELGIERAGDQVVDMFGVALESAHVASRLGIGHELGVSR
jgi:hypothetical protein